MPIVVNLDVMMARRHKGAGELAEEISITPANLSILKNNKARAVRLSILHGERTFLNGSRGENRGSCWSTWKRNHDAFYAGANACIRPRVDAIIDPYKVHGSRMK